MDEEPAGDGEELAEDITEEIPEEIAERDPMDVDTALRVLGRITTEEQEEAANESAPVEVLRLVMAFRERLDEAIPDADSYEFEEREAASVFRLIELVRQHADSIERDLLRHMKFGAAGMTWAEVAYEVNAQIGGRQAMQKRWARLTAATRRTATGDMRRGNAVRRRPVKVNDTTTSAGDGS